VHQRLQHVAERYGFSTEDVPKDGDCALHAIIDQLKRVGKTYYTVASLRAQAVEWLCTQHIDRGFFVHAEHKDFDSYLAEQCVCGTWCDEIMLRSISNVLEKEIVIFNENGHKSVVVPTKATRPTIKNNDYRPMTSSTSRLHLGLMTDFHYVSFVALDRGFGSDLSTASNMQHGVAGETVRPTDTGANSIQTDTHTTAEYPGCWTLDQWTCFHTQYSWLVCNAGCLGCSICGEIKSLGPAGAQGSGI